MYGMAKWSHYIYSTVDKCIFMEDDDMPAISWIRIAKELLDKYENDQRVYAICSNNLMGKYDKPQADYCFSHASSIHCMAMWRRSWKQVNIDYHNIDKYTIDNTMFISREDGFAYEKTDKKGMGKGRIRWTSTFCRICEENVVLFIQSGLHYTNKKYECECGC